MHEAVQLACAESCAILGVFLFFFPHTQAKFTSKKAEIAITTAFSEIFALNVPNR